MLSSQEFGDSFYTKNPFSYFATFLLQIENSHLFTLQMHITDD